MKNPKFLLTLVLAFALSFGLTNDVTAKTSKQKKEYRKAKKAAIKKARKERKAKIKKRRSAKKLYKKQAQAPVCKKPENPTVGAPLDGGLLTVLLGGAGAAYFARKRKKQN